MSYWRYPGDESTKVKPVYYILNYLSSLHPVGHPPKAMSTTYMYIVILRFIEAW